jgi:predicted amidophosphoribosyltransferase
MELLQEARDLGFLDLESTTFCSNCHASFPKEYATCPSCKNGIFIQDMKIEF